MYEEVPLRPPEAHVKCCPPFSEVPASAPPTLSCPGSACFSLPIFLFQARGWEGGRGGKQGWVPPIRLLPEATTPVGLLNGPALLVTVLVTS